MKRVWRVWAKVLAGLFATAMFAMPQAYTMSARPGVVNYTEGNVSLDGRPLTLNNQEQSVLYLNANDTLSTTNGKAEVLLTPGVFLRVGDDSEIRMVSPDLVNTQVAVTQGEAMLEVDQLLKDNHLSILDHGASITIEKTGLYRFTGPPMPSAAVIDGEARVWVGDTSLKLGKGRETQWAAGLKAQKFDTKREDDLYAWSNVRSESAAAASYQEARNVYVNNYYDGFGGYGPGWGYGWGSGWFWNAGFDSWAWLPYDGAFFSPFGWGFYSPSYIPYGYVGRGWHGHVVGVNPRAPGVTAMTRSVWANHAARTQASRGFAGGGFRSGGGVPAGASGFHGGGFAGGGFGGGFHGGGGHR